nr:Spliceosome-associated protein SPF 27 [Euglena gracilis]|eukprot:EG_transcript_24575
MTVPGPPTALPARVTVDALPYIDPPVPEDLQNYVNALIEEEMTRFSPANYLEHLPPPPLQLTPLLAQEFERVRKGAPLQALDTRRYEIPQPPAAGRADVGKWREAVSNAYAQLEHQSLRIINLDLLNKHGKSAWLRHNQYLEAQQEPLAAAQRQLKRKIDEVNRSRKSLQVGAAHKLRQLEETWRQLVEKNVELQLECDRLQRRIKRVRQF